MDLNVPEWKEFTLNKVFTLVGGFYNKKPEHSCVGNIPFLASTESNNGVTEYYCLEDIRSWDKVGEPDDTLEKKIYDGLQKAAQAWDEHGAQTLLLQKAIEYLKTPEVQHTANQWKQRKDGTWEISNLVYKMTYTIEKVRDEWKLTWELEYTSPGYKPPTYYSPYDNSPRPRIEREGSKKYKTLEGAQKYIQGKYDEFAHLFMELSPPIPPEAKMFFCVNGQLLQGYTMAPKERTTQDVADDLLGLLDDGDLMPPAVDPAKSPVQPAPVSSPPKSQSSTPKIKDPAPKKKRAALAR